MSYCSKCGAELEENSKFCPKCGAATEAVVTTNVASDDVSPKKKLPAFLTAILVGNFGVHDFYLGNIGRGVFKAIFSTIGYIFYFIGFFLIGISDTSYGNDEATILLICAIVFLSISIIFIIIPAIIQLVDWIKILSNKGVDKNGKRVINWT